MKRKSGKQICQGIWQSLTIRKKIWVLAGVVFFIIFLSVIFDLWVVKFSLDDFQAILEDNARSSDFADAIEAESKWFAEYIKNPSEENLKELQYACHQTSLTIARLHYDYTSMSVERYAKTWSILNGYEGYKKQRDYVLEMGEENLNYINELYKVYDMQKFLQSYARALMRYTLEEGKDIYLNKVPILRKIPFIILFFGILIFIGIISSVSLMNQKIILPIVNLAEVAKKIADNKFFQEDIKAESQDEVGDLVRAFNKMKDATSQYIQTLEEKREMAYLLHKEELERIEIEKHLERTKFELLKNQIKPHFLFNTLNVIGGMANLENAKTTEKMIKALSSLFRYNLKTPQAEVVLAQELQIVKDYMYLQQMRFGNRIGYSIECKLDTEDVNVPIFSFQPLIENAIIHGLSKKEEGGKIYIRIWREEQYTMISIADTGMGMTQDKLDSLRNTFKKENTEQMGIGLGNIYRRVHAMYPNGKIEIFSKVNAGTVIRLKIPQKKWEK